MSRLVLIDGDVIAYRCLAAATRTAYEIVQPNREVVDFVEPGRIDGKTGPQRAEEIAKQYPGSTVSKVSEEPPLENVGHLVSEVLDHASVVYPGPRRIFLSSSQVFRHEIYPEYKGNRPPRPRMLPEVREMLVEGFGAEVCERIEADDALAILARQNTSSVILSNDKDMYQVPGLHYDPWARKEIIIDDVQAEINLWTQVIAGDRVDNIKGVPNFATKKATKYLEQFDEPEEFGAACAVLYSDSGLSFDDFRIGYHLVKLLDDWDPVLELARQIGYLTQFKSLFDEE